MAFVDLDNPKASSGRRCPRAGVMVSVRESGPKTSRSRYLAILIGPDAAKALNFHSSPTPIRVQLGSGQDAGRLRIAGDQRGKFEARRQPGGGFLTTVKAAAMDGRFKDTFEPFTIEKARIVPGTGQDAPCTILPVDAIIRGGAA
jgi:hypothetical protein